MKKFLKSFSLLVFFVCIFALFRYPYSAFNQDIAQAIKSQAEQAGILLSIDQLEVHFPANLHLSGVHGYFPTPQGLPLPFAFESVGVYPKLWQLLRLETAGETTVNGYAGEISAWFTNPIFGESMAFQGKIKHLDLNKHPLLALNGVHGTIHGKLDATFEKVPSSALPLVLPPLLEGNMEISLENGQLTAGAPLGGLLPLPSVKDARLSLLVTGRGQQLRLEKFDFSSSLGSATGTGSVELSPTHQLLQTNLTFHLKLSDDGVNQVGGYLALAAQIPVESRQSEFKVTILQPRNKPPRATVSAL